jgi:hypothetical protein
LNDLPTPDNGDLISWLADFGGDDQWVESGPDGVSGAAVVLGDRIIIWQDEPLTDEEKRIAIAEYQEKMTAELEREQEECGRASAEERMATETESISFGLAPKIGQLMERLGFEPNDECSARAVQSGVESGFLKGCTPKGMLSRGKMWAGWNIVRYR